ncbi:hypothetical protein M758_UG324800 [Ceratodon purpureus]|nr:hypothetical protein M758_UG324800 [Ceratodon purpureus]
MLISNVFVCRQRICELGANLLSPLSVREESANLSTYKSLNIPVVHPTYMDTVTRTPTRNAIAEKHLQETNVKEDKVNGCEDTLTLIH